MPRPSRVENLAKLLKNEKAMNEIGSKIVRAALARSAMIAGISLNPGLYDPPWGDIWSDGPDNPGWGNNWLDNGGGDPHWSDSWSDTNSPPWDNEWDNSSPGGIGSIISQGVLPFFSPELTAKELQILANLKITAPQAETRAKRKSK